MTELATTEECEQAAAHLAQTAWLAESYYRALTAQKLPPELCHDLVVAWHAQAISGEDDVG